jgi:hypothetical protein
MAARLAAVTTMLAQICGFLAYHRTSNRFFCMRDRVLLTQE